MTNSTITETIDRIQELQASPMHGIKPIAEYKIKLSLLEKDPTNPGSDPYSERYKHREKPISESYDILDTIIYPLVVSTKDDNTGRFILVDGHGRFDEAERRFKANHGPEELNCVIFPRLTDEQRIILRQLLNGAQAPFDTPLILRDLQLRAKLRNLDIKNEADLHALLVDFPENIRKHEKKLRVVAKWPEDVADRIGVDDDDQKGVVGFDKIRELDSFVNILKKRHPKSAEPYPDTKLNSQALHLYFNGKFNDGKQKSLEGIRKSVRIIKALEKDDPLVAKFLKGTMPVEDFAELAEEHKQPTDKILELCKKLNLAVIDIDVQELDTDGQRTLKIALSKTHELLSQTLKELDTVAFKATA